MLALILEILYQKGVLSEEEIKTISSFSTFEKILTDKILSCYATKEEREYFSNLSKALRNGDLTFAVNLYPPPSLQPFHRRFCEILRALSKDVTDTHN